MVGSANDMFNTPFEQLPVAGSYGGQDSGQDGAQVFQVPGAGCNPQFAILNRPSPLDIGRWSLDDVYPFDLLPALPGNYVLDGSMRTNPGKYVRYRAASLVSKVMPSIAAWAPMKKSGNGACFNPPARQYFKKHLPARKAAS